MIKKTEQRGGRGSDSDDIEERVIFVNRCSKVVKGGRRFSFSAVVVCGTGRVLAGFGFGKANVVSVGIRKGGEIAKRSLQHITMKDLTIPHEVIGVFDGCRVKLRPACPGTGVIAGGGVRAVLELAGVHDVLGKSLGSSNKLNIVKATFGALNLLRSREEVLAARGLVSAGTDGDS